MNTEHLSTRGGNFISLLICAGAFLMPACYHHNVAHTVDYAVAEWWPEQNQAETRFQVFSVVIPDNTARADQTGIASVFVNKPDWRAMTRMARKLERRHDVPLTVHFFASDLHVPNFKRTAMIPDDAKPFLAASYSRQTSPRLERHGEAFENAREDYERYRALATK